jgi:putative mRNA 3-end processing factor
VLQADVLVTEATYGNPACVRPFRAEVESLFLELVRQRLAQGPVCVVGYHGKLQEAAGLLHRAGIEAPILAPERVYQALQVCRQHGLGPDAGLWEAAAPLREGSPEAQEARAGAYIRLRHTAQPGPVEEPTRILLSGWQFDAPCRQLSGGAWQVALSDHCDFAELLDYVWSSGARLVIADAFRSQSAGVFAAEVQRRLGVRAIAMPQPGDGP